MKPKNMMLVLVMGAFALLMSAPAYPVAEWQGNVFESEMEMVLSPSDREPFNMEPLEIVITSRSGAFVNAADVRFTWSYEGKVSAEGGYAFTRVNQSSMKGTIPGHPGGYTITYRIVAYDEKNTPLTSTHCSYLVKQNGSFDGTDFAKNINLSWGPKAPKNNHGVHLNLTAKDDLVTISRADLFYTVSIPNQDPVDGVTFFEMRNGTITSDIIFYPPGSKVTFRVEAYDSYFNKIVSQSYTYEYPRLPPSQPVYIGYIFVQFRDVSRDGYVDQDQDLMVTFSNETYSYTMEARAGIAQTNRTVYQGAYKVEATYYNKTYVWTVNVPKPDGSFSFLFDVNEKTYKVPYDERASASWLPVIGLTALFALLALSVFASIRTKAYYERLAEEKKKRRRKGEEEEAPRWA